jgi:hypothetical protein
MAASRRPRSHVNFHFGQLSARLAWRDAIYGGLLVSARPKRAAAARADRMIDVATADARRGVDEDAAIDAYFARAAAVAAPPPLPAPAPMAAPAPPRRNQRRMRAQTQPWGTNLPALSSLAAANQ